MYRVTLTFVVDVDEGKAWDIADGLERAAMAQNYRECNGWASAVAGGRGLVPEGQEPPKTPAETVVRQTGAPMAIGDAGGTVSLGGDDGSSR